MRKPTWKPEKENDYGQMYQNEICFCFGRFPPDIFISVISNEPCHAVGFDAPCFYRPETASVLGGSLLLCGAAAFLAYRFLLRFAPRTIAGQ